jgi:hypothetical protein
MGKGGGGGGQPSQTTAYQTNLPEYAKPYVMNMLGAAQNQLFQTSGGEITGFRPYTPYSTDPTQYFAGPSSLQQGVYQEAGRMQTPGQYAPATGLAGVAGMGQLGAGADYMRNVTDPSRVGAFMSPYQQQVTDIAKMNAVREAQIAGQQANLGAARQGTYGGARQALMGAEREKNLLANLSNIQAQGSQAAYDKAIQAQQFGANLGLQGLQGAASTAGTLGGLGTAQQQADLARMGFQQQTGAAQQQYQQNIINQAIQDFATAQQYPYMQLSTMSNLLRGLPMQSMSTQQYQAQPSLGQQALGLAGAYGAYKGMFAEGGEVKGYRAGGLSDVEDSLEAKMKKMAKTDPKGLARLISQSSSKEVKELGQEVLSGIAGAPTGDLGRNLAGGGIIAFADEGQVKDPDAGMTDEEREDYIKNNAYLQRSRAVKEAFSPLGKAENWDPIRSSYNLVNRGIMQPWNRFISEKPEDQATRFRKASARKEQAANPTQEVPAAKTATQRTQEAKERDDKELADAAGQSSKVDYKRAEEILRASKGSQGDGTGGAGAAGEGGAGGRSPYGLNATMTGIGDAYKQVQGLLGTDKPDEQLAAYEDLIAGKQGQLGLRAGEMDRMSKAIGFLKMAQNPRGITAGALDGFESYLVSSAANKKEQDKIELDLAKVRADISKARREEAKGNFELAEKLYDNTQKRLSERMQATKPSEFDRMYSVYAQGEIAAGRKPSFEGFRRAYTGTDEDLARLSKAEIAVKALRENPANMQLAMSKKPEDKEKLNKMVADTYIFYGIDPTTGKPLSSGETASAGGGNRLRFNAKGEPV